MSASKATTTITDRISSTRSSNAVHASGNVPRRSAERCRSRSDSRSMAAATSSSEPSSRSHTCSQPRARSEQSKHASPTRTPRTVTQERTSSNIFAAASSVIPQPRSTRRVGGDASGDASGDATTNASAADTDFGIADADDDLGSVASSPVGAATSSLLRGASETIVSLRRESVVGSLANRAGFAGRRCRVPSGATVKGGRRRGRRSTAT